MNKGFTLVEILIVLVILILIFGVGLASYREFSRRQVVASAARELRGNLRLAQERALQGKKPTGCDFLNGYYFWVNIISPGYSIGANCDNGLQPPEKTVNLSGNLVISIDSASFAISPFYFKVLGSGTNIPQGTIVTITLGQNGSLVNSLNVRISPDGVIE